MAPAAAAARQRLCGGAAAARRARGAPRRAPPAAAAPAAGAEAEAAARERYNAEHSKGFHQGRYAAEAARQKAAPLPHVTVRGAQGDGELAACARLRARTFYPYPPERAFAGSRQQRAKGDGELARLREEQAERVPQGQYAVLVAAVARSALAGHEAEAYLLAEVGEDGYDLSQEVIVGTVDVELTDILGGQPLVGDKGAPGRRAYLSNVCTAEAARRRGVGSKLLAAAEEAARQMGAEALYVHALYVNAQARAAYEASGFVLEGEESVQSARNRGMCLDGIEGRARTVVLGKPLLRDVRS